MQCLTRICSSLSFQTGKAIGVSNAANILQIRWGPAQLATGSHVETPCLGRGPNSKTWPVTLVINSYGSYIKSKLPPQSQPSDFLTCGNFCTNVEFSTETGFRSSVCFGPYLTFLLWILLKSCLRSLSPVSTEEIVLEVYFRGLNGQSKILDVCVARKGFGKFHQNVLKGSEPQTFDLSALVPATVSHGFSMFHLHSREKGPKNKPSPQNLTQPPYKKRRGTALWCMPWHSTKADPMCFKCHAPPWKVNC